MTETTVVPQAIEHLDFELPCVVSLWNVPCATPATFHCHIDCPGHRNGYVFACAEHRTTLAMGLVFCGMDNRPLILLSAVPL